MSAPLKLDADQLHRLAAALRHLTDARTDTGVVFDAYSPLDVRVDDSTLQVSWDPGLEQYVVDDRNGS
ncbi:hypothetical protein [Nocardioides sp. PD653]|uniref:hypothetical protein n=1 Tax=Nocardioides sp. PD653 TaxID=393303 RepID=UPI0009EFEF79|nr:hypothetical protein [Nocardioides sp. PD653]GAW54718.1 Related to D-arabinono-1,4-lactone oxidase [Nocardioides sp. PD653]